MVNQVNNRGLSPIIHLRISRLMSHFLFAVRAD